jgi:hypothetical protein
MNRINEKRLTARKKRKTRYMMRVDERLYILLWCVPNKEIKYNFLANTTSPPVYFLITWLAVNVIIMVLWVRNTNIAGFQKKSLVNHTLNNYILGRYLRGEPRKTKSTGSREFLG